LEDGIAAYAEMVRNLTDMAALFTSGNLIALTDRITELEGNFAIEGFANTFTALLPPAIARVIKMSASLSLDGVRHALTAYKEGRITEEEFLASLTALTHSHMEKE